MPAPVRVRDDNTGHEFTTYAVDEHGRVDKGLTVLKDEAAVDERTGKPLPAKPAPAKRAAAEPTPGPKATSKEN